MDWIFRPDSFLHIELRTQDLPGVFNTVYEWSDLPRTPPDYVSYDFGKKLRGKRFADWRRVAPTLSDSDVVWETRSSARGRSLHTHQRFKQVAILDSLARPHIASTFALLQEVDFELAEGPMGDEFTLPDGSSYMTNGFGGGLAAHGWMCAFKGEEGHGRLVSRRWLEWGPWRLIRDDERDLSMVQFCDVEAEDDERVQQAIPGIDRMGICSEGGFIQPKMFPWSYDWQGRYDPDRRVFEVVVAGRNLEPFEMLEARALVWYQSLGPEHPLDRVSFVFLEPDRGLAHLHELWLRDLECWVVRGGRRERLDDSYHPDRADPSTAVWFPPDAPYPSPGPRPEPWPAWVAEVEARERAAGVFLPSSLPGADHEPAGPAGGPAAGPPDGPSGA